LVFTTDDGVQPRAQLIANPTRLVIDLPGTTVGRASVPQPVGGGIREVRVGQFNAQTTRIVVELNPGYTIDPEQIQVRGATPTEWSVQLPTPQPIESDSSLSPQPAPDSPPASAPTPPIAAATQLEAVRVTPDGFFVRTRGATPEIEVDRSRDRRQFTIDLEDTAISPQLTQLEQSIDRFGVDRLVISQVETSPPLARITLELSSTEADWRATASNLGGVVIVPTGAIASVPEPEATEPLAESLPAPPAPAEPATIQAVELAEDGSQLLVQADQPLTYDSGWDRPSAAYRITIPNARLAEQVTPPQLAAGSPLLRVRLLQQNEQTVVILVQPAAGVQIGQINQPADALALQLQRGSQVSPSQRPIPVTPPGSISPPETLPQVPNSRVVIVIDPGHGGPDPGAVGIGGLREVEVVLPISLEVAALLEQQGAQVILTRSTERDLDLEPRVQIANRANADLFVSIHANAISLSRPDVNGVETYYYGSGNRLAQVIHSSIIQATGSVDRGVRRARFYVLRNTEMPAVLVEVGFVTGQNDARQLSDPAYRSQMAAAIARGILQYVQQNF
jgi:N-acetylmuramoyl-L-alanine amidase